MSKPQTLLIDGHEVTVTQVRDGEIVVRNGRNTRLGQAFEVSWNGNVIGAVERRMLTRERKTPGRRYVNARWESPGWVRQCGTSPHSGRGLECSTKREGIESLLRDALYA